MACKKLWLLTAAGAKVDPILYRHEPICTFGSFVHLEEATTCCLGFDLGRTRGWPRASPVVTQVRPRLPSSASLLARMRVQCTHKYTSRESSSMTVTPSMPGRDAHSTDSGAAHATCYGLLNELQLHLSAVIKRYCTGSNHKSGLRASAHRSDILDGRQLTS